MILNEYSISDFEAEICGNGHKTCSDMMSGHKSIMDIPIDMVISSEIMGNGI